MRANLTLLARSREWDNQFTYRVWQLQPLDAEERVAAAWLAGYNACLEMERDGLLDICLALIAELKKCAALTRGVK